MAGKYHSMSRILHFFTILFIAFFFLIPNQVKATHIMGGEVTWECNGSGQYVFTFKIYRDCSGSFNGFPNSSFSLYNGSTGVRIRTLTENAALSQDNDIVPPCRGGSPFSCGTGNGDPEVVKEFVRVMNPVTLTGTPPVGGWVVTYSDNARNANDNLVNSSSQGMTLRAKIYNHADFVPGTCVDNSPKFRERATSMLCLNSTFTYNHNATDDELDSLVYEWDQPLDNFTGNYNEGTNPSFLSFVNPLTFNNPFPGPEALDLTSGEITVTPNQLGKYVSCVKVSAYKCGAKVAEIYRELQSVVFDCGLNVRPPTKPIITPPFNNNTSFKDTVRAGDLVTFNITADDVASLDLVSIPPYFGDSLSLFVSGLQWGANLTDPNTGCINPPCATLSQSPPIKSNLTLNETFTWQTDCNHVSFTDRCVSGQNTYNFVLTVQDDECNYPQLTIATISITVVGDSVILSPKLNCVDVQTNGDVSLDWNTTPNINSSFTAWLIYSSTDRNGPFTLIDSIKNYNTTTYTHVGAGADQQQRFYHVRSRSGCKGVVVNVARDTVGTIFVDPVTNPTTVDVNWTPLSSPNPTGSASQYNVFREYPLGSGLNAYTNTSNTTIAENFPICEDDVRYRVQLSNPTEGCVSRSNIADYRFKFPDPQTNFSFPANSCPQTVVNFTNLTTITGGTITYTWDFGDGSGTSNATSPTHTYSSPGTYNVVLTANSGKGCDSTLIQAITITFPDADAGPNRSICPGGSVQIGGSPTSTTAGVTYSWSPAGSLNNPSLANPTASPSSTTVYTVTVTDPSGCTNTDQVTVNVNAVPTADAGTPQTICEGTSTLIGGSPTGPAGATYAWSNGTSLDDATLANPTASPTVTTTYTVTVTSGVNCSATDQVTITVINQPDANAGADQSICPGGSVLIGGSPTSLSAGATFAWSPSASLSNASIANPTASPTTTTTYTVTVTATNGCTNTDDVTVNVNSAPNADAGLASYDICIGGAIQIGGASTGTNPLTYAWNNGGSLSATNIQNPIANPSVTTIYTLTVTDGNGCTSTDLTTVNVNSLPTANAGADQTICEGSSTGIGSTPIGGNTYAWDNATSLNNANIANPTASPIVTTIYTVTVTSGANCTATDQVTITVNPTPTVDAGADQTICNGNPVQIGGSPTSGSVGATFAWNNGASLSNASAANPMASPTVTTVYTVTVTDGNGCTATDDVTVFVNNNPTTDAGADQTICDGANAVIGGSPTGPAGSTYAWSNGASLNDATLANPTASPTVTTTYTVTVTSGLNCTATDQVTITVNPNPDADAGADQTICNGGSVQIGGSPTSTIVGATFAWDNGASLSNAGIANPTASPATTTTYTVTVTHPNGCTNTDDVTVTVNSLPNVDAGADQSICIGGSVQIGGSPTGPVGSTYSWDNGASLSSSTIANPTANPSTTTTYTVTVTDVNGCTETDDITVTVNTLPTADAGADQTICDGESIQIGGSPTGPAGATYQWNNVASLSSGTAANPMATPNTTTTYTVTVTNGNNCTSTDQVIVTVNPTPTVDAGTDQTICNGNPVQIGGAPTSTTTGATFAWDNGASLSNASIANPTATPLITTIYTVTVTHPNGCTATDDVTVFVNNNPTADAGADQTICDGANAVIGGSPTGPAGSTYAWSNGASLNDATLANPTASPTVTTTYTVTVTSGLNCTATDQVTITVNPNPDADAGADQTICNGGSVQIGGSPTSTIVGATFAWDNGASLSNAGIANPTASPATTTTYTVTVTHPNGCTNTDDVTVTVNSLPNVDAGADQSICIGGSVQIGGSPTGPVGSTYSWDNGASLSSSTIANPTANPSTTTTYTVTVTDVNGCTETDDITVTVNTLPTADAGADQTICDGESIQIGGSPTGPAGATYQWNNVASLSSGTAANPMATPNTTTTYTVTVTNGNNCTSTDQVIVTVNPTPTVDAGTDQTICNGNPVQIGGAPTSTTAGATFAWDNGASLSNPTIANPIANPSVATVYTVTVTHPNGCTATDDVLVSVNGLPPVDAGADQTICIGTNAVIGGSPTGPAGSSYAWDNGATLSSNSVANPTASPTSTTIYTVTVTDINGCTGTDNVTITVSPFPDVDAGPNRTICEGDNIQIGGSPTSTTAGATFAWDNAGSLDDPTLANPTANPIVTTTYTVIVTHPNGCTLSDNMTVNVNPAPATDAGPDQALCIGSSVMIGGSPTGPVGSTYAWDNMASLNDPTLANPTATPSITTTYTVTVTDLNFCTNTDDVTITVNPLPVVDAGADQTICDGDNAVIGGSPTGPAGSTFAWDNGASLSSTSTANPTANPTVTTTYTVTVTDVNGCVNTDQVVITVNPVPDVDAGADQTICDAQSVLIGGSPTSTVAGAIFAWDNGTSLDNATIANPTASPATTTTYTVTVTHPNGCTATDAVVVTVNALPNADAGVDQNLCIGSSTSIGGSPTGPASSTFVWDNGTSLSSTSDPNPTANPVVTTTYTVTVTDGNGCTNTDQVVITVIPVPDADAGADQTICDGQSIAIGGSPTSTVVGATFSWDNGTSLSATNVSNPTANPNTTTTYTVTVTHPNGCTATDAVVVTVNPLPNADAGPDQALCIGGSVQIGGSPTGPAGTSFTWDNAATLSSATDPNPIATPNITTIYSVTVTDGNGCTNTDQMTVTVNPLPFADAGPDITICLGETTVIGGSPTGPAGSTYEWFDGVTISNFKIPNLPVSPIVTTTYTVTVTDVNGCTNTDQVTVTVLPVPDVDAGPDQTICANGSVLIGGSPTSMIIGATFAWDNGATLSSTIDANPTASPSVTTTYTVTVTHPNGCTATDAVVVTVNPLPSANAGVDQDLCIGSSTSIGGSPTGPAGSTFAWDNGTSLSSTSDPNPTANPVVTTTYTVTVTDGNGCTNTDQVVITVIPVPDADAGADQTICDGQSIAIGGSPTSTVVGATFSWDNGTSLSATNVSNPTANPNTTTTYTVTVTHPNGCTATDAVVVTVNPLPNADAGADQVICIGQTVRIGGNPTGPIGATFTWSDPATLDNANSPNPNATPNVTTTYTVTVIDVNSCTKTDQVTVTVNPLPVVDAGADITICEGTSTVIGGSPTGPAGSTYIWDNAASLDDATIANPTATPATTTTYTVTVTDVNGCVNTDDIIVTINPLPDVDAGADITICDRDTVTIGGSPTSSTVNTTFLWDNSSTLDDATLANPRAFPFTTTTYTVTVTDAFGCTSTDQMTMTVNPLPQVEFQVDATCFGDFTAFTDQSTIVSGSIQSWDWDFGDGTGSSILQNPGYQYAASGTYSVRLLVTSALGCQDSIVKQVVVNPLPVVDAGADAEICFGDTIEIGGSPTGPIGSTFSWNPGLDLSDVSSPNPLAYPLSTTKYYISVIDQNNCVNTDSILITVNPLPIVEATPDDTSVCKDELVPLNATGAISYAWLPSDNLDNPLIANPIATSKVNVDYVVYGTDANGCVNTDTVKIETFNVNFNDATVEVCFGDSIELMPITQGNQSGITYHWSPSSGLSATNISNPKASPAVDQNYQLRISNDENCTDIDSVFVEVNETPVLRLDVLNSPRCSGSVLEITNLSTFATDFEWYLNGEFKGRAYQPNFAIDNSIENELVLVGSNANCTDSLQLIIEAAPLLDLLQLKYANVFTPNGDGINDLFDLGFTGEFIGCANFQVYDRWGDKVFDSNIGAYGWNGYSLKGKQCPQGMYFYVVKLGTEEIRGSVFLSR